ncbi:MAG: PmoA family protein, partial [bacterium]|nr:PmoA family protein [bacterium]
MATVMLRVQAGPHRRIHCPVSAFVSAEKTISTAILTQGRKNVPCSVRKERGGLQVSWIVDDLAAGASAVYTLTTGKAPGGRTKGVEVSKGRGEVAVSIGGTHFTTYCYGKHLARPHLYPVIGPYGDPVTRRLATPEDGRGLDHHHHRSIWISHGEVNSWDNWSEGAGHGRTVHKRFEALESGPAVGRVVSKGVWVGTDGWQGPPGKT